MFFIYFSKNHCKWKLLNLLRLSDSFNGSWYCILAGLDTKIMVLLQVVARFGKISIFANSAPRVKLWESRCTPEQQPIAKKF